MAKEPNRPITLLADPEPPTSRKTWAHLDCGHRRLVYRSSARSAWPTEAVCIVCASGSVRLPPATREDLEKIIQTTVANWNGDRETKQSLQSAIYDGIAPFLR